MIEEIITHLSQFLKNDKLLVILFIIKLYARNNMLISQKRVFTKQECVCMRKYMSIYYVIDVACMVKRIYIVIQS